MSHEERFLIRPCIYEYLQKEELKKPVKFCIKELMITHPEYFLRNTKDEFIIEFNKKIEEELKIFKNSI